MMRRTKLAVGLITVVVLLVAGRLALPYIVKDQVNRQLAGLDDYTGHVDEIDIALWRGEYAIHGLVIEKIQENTSPPLLLAPETAISLQWDALFDGRIVGEVEMFAPELNVTASPAESEQQAGADEPWYAVLEDLVPFRVNEFKVNNGRLAFRDTRADAEVDVFISELNALVENLSNVEETDADSFATAELSGRFGGNAPIYLNGQLNPLADPPMFEADFELETVPLVELNSLLEAYAGVVAEAGTFSVYAEFASADGRFEGYVKPILENPQFTTDEETDSLLRKFWAATVDLAATIFENEQEEQVASQIPFSGELETVDAGIFPAILSILENAFIAALSPQVEGTVELEDVGADSQDADQQDTQ